MVIYVKKIKAKEGVNAIDLDKIKNAIPAGFTPTENDPVLSFTGNHIVIGFKCLVIGNPKEKSKPKTKTKSKKIVIAKV